MQTLTIGRLLLKKQTRYNDKVEFLNTEVLEPKEVGHLVNTVLLDYAKTDINNKQRNADHPTMGAYEFSSEVLIPKSVAGYPEVVNITDNSADVKIKADENGKAYILVKKQTEEAPSVDDVKEQWYCYLCKQRHRNCACAY